MGRQGGTAGGFERPIEPDAATASARGRTRRAVNALCPNCGETEGERTGRSRDPENGLEVSFNCPDCDHEWSVTL